MASDGSLLYFSEDQVLYRFQSDGDFEPFFSPPLALIFPNFHTSPALLADGTTYVATSKLGYTVMLYAISAEGTLLWGSAGSANNWVCGELAVGANGSVYVPTCYNDFIAYK